MGAVKVGLVGVGDISGIYLKNIHEVFHEIGNWSASAT